MLTHVICFYMGNQAGGRFVGN